MTRKLMILGFAAATACGGRASDEAAPFPPGDEPQAVAGDTLDGVINVVGADPLAEVVIRSGDRSTAVTGAMREEVGRLAGARVRIWGPTAPGRVAAARAVEVTGYEILEVAGERPYVGVLEARGADLWLTGERELRVLDPPAELRERLGAKVWITGTDEGGALRLRSYGVLRDP